MSEITFESVLQQALQLDEADQLRLIVMLQASIRTDTTKTLARVLDRSAKKARTQHEPGADERRQCTEHSIELNAIDPNDQTLEMTSEWREHIEDWIGDSSLSVTDTH